MVAIGTSVASTMDAWAYQDRISAQDARYALASLLMPISGATNISYRGGVFASGDSGSTTGPGTHLGMRVTVAASGLNVNVAMGNCVIDTASNGPYMCTLDSQKTLSLASASSTQNRYDLIIARVYDDGNTAISSPTGTRKFTVEVWTGDGATGTPTVPTPSVSAGWIKLAQVYVPKNSGNSNLVVTDLRGPGLVARGGMRGLYGPDAVVGSAAWNEAGAYPGDQRFVFGNTFPHQVYYGQSTNPTKGGWRGVQNEIKYEVTCANTGQWIWTKGAGAIREICRVTIQDPGTPYEVEADGRLVTQVSPGTAVDVCVRLDEVLGWGINFVGDDTGNVNADTRHVFAVPAKTYGPLTGSHVIILTGQVIATTRSDFGFGYYTSNAQNILTVRVKPQMAPPPGV